MSGYPSLLDLAARAVRALVKALAVAIGGPDEAAAAAGDNVLCGTVQRFVRGNGPVEVVNALSAGTTVRGVTTLARLQALCIAEQQRACARCPALTVVIGVD